MDRDFIGGKNDPTPASGSTCASFLLAGRRLFAANVGDSRVVLCRRNGGVIEMTSDHKPTREDEAKRIKEAGGFILHRRVMGELAISRAFGDKSFKLGIKSMMREGDSSDEDGMGGEGKDGESKDAEGNEPLVVAEPEITEVNLDPEGDEFILVACDGLFDVFSSADAIAFVRDRLIQLQGDPATVAGMLSNEAINVRRSRDNVSILIVVLRPFWRGS
jgi:protein phosphatase